MEEAEPSSIIKPVIFLFTIIAAILLLSKAVDYFSLDPHRTSLHESHASIEKCDICHHPMKEVRPVNCSRLGCHSGKKFRAKRADAESALAPHIEMKDCLDCHTDHKGKTAKITIDFDHEKVSEDVRCSGCHLVPKRHLETGGEDCGECHEVTNFAKPARV